MHHSLRSFFGKDFVPFGELVTKSQDNLPPGVHTARLTRLYAVDRKRREPGLSRQLGLAHQLRLAQLSDLILLIGHVSYDDCSIFVLARARCGCQCRLGSSDRFTDDDRGHYGAVSRRNLV